MNIYDYLDKFGEALLSACGYKTMELAYGKPFVFWYNTRHIFGK